MSEEPLLKKLGKHTFNFGLGKVLPKVIGFFLIPVYTAFLSPEDFGIVDLAGSLSVFIIILMRLGMTGSVVRFYYDFQEGPGLRDYVTTIFWFLMIASTVIGLLTLLISYEFIDTLVPGLPFFPFVILVVMGAVLQSNTDLQRRLVQVREQSLYSAKLSTATAFIAIVLTLLFVVVLKMGALGVILASTITAFLFFIQAQFYLKEDLKGKFQKILLKPSFKYALGILPYHLIGQVAPLLNKSLLSNFDSLAAVGILSIAHRFASPLDIIRNAFQTAYSPLYFKIRIQNSKEGLLELANLYKSLWIIASILCLGVSTVVPHFVVIMTPEQFHLGAEIVPYYGILFMLGIIGIIYGQEIFYSKKTFWSPIISSTTVGVNILVVILLIEQLGIFAIVYAMILSGIVSTLFKAIVSHRLVKIPKNLGFFFKTTLLLVIIFFAYRYMAGTFPSPITGVALGSISIVIYLSLILLFGFIKMAQLQSFLNTLRRKRK